jgi:hypothetical protein
MCAQGLRLAAGVVTGADACAVAMLRAFQFLVRDYVPPANKSVAHALENHLKPCV